MPWAQGAGRRAQSAERRAQSAEAITSASSRVYSDIRTAYVAIVAPTRIQARVVASLCEDLQPTHPARSADSNRPTVADNFLCPSAISR